MIITQLCGGLGNQLFQYACARALAARNGSQLKLDLHRYQDPTYAEKRPYLLDRLRITATPASPLQIRFAHGGRLARALTALAPSLRFHFLKEEGMQFHPQIPTARGNIYLAGFWQSEHYFTDIAHILRTEFEPLAQPSPENRLLLDQIRACQSVSVHIRRGDYARVPGFHMLTPDYYRRAAQLIQRTVPSPHYFIFSDDPHWARQNLPLPSATFVHHNAPTHPEEDLRLMRACAHHIIANSTFSWWPAWLCQNPSKQIIAPAPWFADPNKNASDIVPKTWVQLPLQLTPPAPHPTPTPAPALSVIVCTRDRAPLLTQCLDALAALQAPPQPWELIVVDNASRDDTPRLLQQETDRARLPLRVIEKHRPGLSRARNAGLRAARAPAIIFLDDDALPHPGWLRAYHQLLITQQLPLVQGRIQLRFLAPRPTWLGPDLLPALSALDLGDQSAQIDLLFGANFAARREVFDQIGHFHIALGAGAAGFGEDTEFLHRARAAGIPVHYAPQARVTHLIPPQRTTRAALLRRYYRSGRCQPLFTPYPHTPARTIAHWLRRSAARLTRALLTRDPAQRMLQLCNLAQHTGRVRSLLKKPRLTPPQEPPE